MEQPEQKPVIWIELDLNVDEDDESAVQIYHEVPPQTINKSLGPQNATPSLSAPLPEPLSPLSTESLHASSVTSNITEPRTPQFHSVDNNFTSNAPSTSSPSSNIAIDALEEFLCDTTSLSSAANTPRDFTPTFVTGAATENTSCSCESTTSTTSPSIPSSVPALPTPTLPSPPNPTLTLSISVPCPPFSLTPALCGPIHFTPMQFTPSSPVPSPHTSCTPLPLTPTPSTHLPLIPTPVRSPYSHTNTSTSPTSPKILQGVITTVQKRKSKRQIGRAYPDSKKQKRITRSDKGAFNESQLTSAIKALSKASAILVTAGNLLSCESGIPNYCNEKEWTKRFPHLLDVNFNYHDAWNSSLFFEKDLPCYCWTFWWDVIATCREAEPEEGFRILKQLCESKLSELGYFVYTDAFDGMFTKAGFSEERMLEYRGNINYVQQCANCCELDVWEEKIVLVKDENFGKLITADQIPVCKCEKEKEKERAKAKAELAEKESEKEKEKEKESSEEEKEKEEEEEEEAVEELAGPGLA
eukprot:Phypoly_transcript_03008.p1 GENE.Phypoly_transcript_03008~~Phypoly_transcript_03008.p1  ORF type:complete len:551 (-),score=101.84 Phypoly_transcript_03008:948-2531(-)